MAAMFEIQEYPVGYSTTSNFIIVSGITLDIRQQANTRWFFNVLSWNISPLSRRMSDFFSSQIWIILTEILTYPHWSYVKIQYYAVKLEEWFVEFSTR